MLEKSKAFGAKLSEDLNTTVCGFLMVPLTNANLLQSMTYLSHSSTLSAKRAIVILALYILDHLHKHHSVFWKGLSVFLKITKQLSVRLI